MCKALSWRAQVRLSRPWCVHSQGWNVPVTGGRLLQLAGESEVKACIRLGLRTAQDCPMIIQRSFMLTQQKTKRVFKTLDGSIAMKKESADEFVVISHKCAEIDKMVPWMMHVSRAVLENVIFVHQEDSAWPLSESRPLKEKFDAIFAATKYTDALVRMRLLIKEKNQVRFPPHAPHSPKLNDSTLVWQCY